GRRRRAGDGDRGGAKAPRPEEFPRRRGAARKGNALRRDPARAVRGEARSREALLGRRTGRPGPAAAGGAGRGGAEVRAGGMGARPGGGGGAGTVEVPQGLGDSREGDRVLPTPVPSGLGGRPRDGWKKIESQEIRPELNRRTELWRRKDQSRRASA